MHRASCRLPKKPSELILLALRDLAKAEQTEGYSIDMGTWHEAADLPIYDPETCAVDKGGVCRVCLAGSVMAFSLNVPRTLDIAPWEFPNDVENVLHALDRFRQGRVLAALRQLAASAVKRAKARKAFGIPADAEDWVSDVEIVEYAADPTLFKKQLRAIARKLAGVGL